LKTSSSSSSFVLLSLALCALLASAASCSGKTQGLAAADAATPGDVASVDGPALDVSVNEAGTDTTPGDGLPPPGSFCALPGSLVWTAQGVHAIAGGPSSTPDLTWLRLPPGFCAHYFATVGDARQLRFAPGGELFVASPTTGTTGGNPSGAISGVIVLPDDDRDGFADSNIVFLTNLPSIQGLLFANGSFYYQDDVTIRRVAYKTGDRQPSAAPVPVFTVAASQAPEHWPKVMDVAQDGTFYVTNGGSQTDVCLSSSPVRGSIFSVASDGSLKLVAKGFRNPIALRCESAHNVCLSAELALDFSSEQGGREKLVPVRAGDDWGFPCCAGQALPYTGMTYMDRDGGTPDCSGVTADTDSFIIGHTPFGLDFETAMWPQPWRGRVFVTLHGVNGSWEGARVVAIPLDPNTGLPTPATELDGGGPNPDSMLDFATGWDDGARDHGRPAPIAFAPDGRLFLGDDNAGLIVWIAPVDLAQP
jgi:glucose/arabinose dehydrogenase